MNIHRIDTAQSDNDEIIGSNRFGTYEINNFMGHLVIGMIGIVADDVANTAQSKTSPDGTTSEEILFSAENLVQVGVSKNGRKLDFLTMRSGSKYILPNAREKDVKLIIRYQVQNAGYMEIIEHEAGEIVFEF